LFAEDMISQYELQKAQYAYNISLENVKKAEFSVQKAETNLNNARIYSPIDGVIISRAVDEGQTVSASLNAPTLFIIANNLQEMQIEAQIDEADIGRVAAGLPVRFTVDAFPELSFDGEVKQVRLNPIFEQNVVMYNVIISASNPDGILMPGMTANVGIITAERKRVVALQERALQFRPSKEVWESFGLVWGEQETPRQSGRRASENAPTESGRRRKQKQESTEVQTARVWILENGVPHSVEIETGISDGTFIEVVSGLKEGQQAIIGVVSDLQGNTSSSAFAAPRGRRF